MTTGRALLIVGAVAFAGAAAVALSSRAPASLRNFEASPQLNDPRLGATFTDDQVARHAAYRRPAYVAFVAGIAIELTLLIALARGPGGRIVDALERLPGGFVVHAGVAGALFAIASTVVALPLRFVRGYVIEKSWGLSTQDLGGWASDVARSLLVGTVMAAIAAAVFFAVVRWQPRWWWVIGWAAFSALSALLVFVYPILIAPLFNDFTPLEDEGLRRAITDLSREADVSVSEVLVADASKRTTAENAYVAGLGGTKRVVLYDTLLESGSEAETLFVVAHELGHDRENHVLKSLGLSVIGLGLSFAALAWLAGRGRLLEWGGATGVSDLRAIPLLLLFAVAAGLLTLPAQNAVSRSFERSADRTAIRLTGDSASAVRSFRRLAFSNLADLRPPSAAVFWLFTHPPVDERIRAAVVTESPPP